MVEAEIHLLFLSEVSVYLSKLFHVMYWWFPNVLKPRRVSGFIINCFSNCKDQGRRKTKKSMTLGKLFSFSRFSNFWKYRNRLWKMFLINYQYFWCLIHYRDLKHAVTMPSHQGYCLTGVYGCIKFFCPKVREFWVIRSKTSQILWQKHALFGKCL